LGSDLRNGLLTLPSLLHLEHRPDGAALATAIRSRRFDERELDALVAEIRASDAIARSLAEAHNAIAAGETQLEGMPDGPERAALRQLGKYVTDRSF
jgi:heptaprenyl diphosphate synthase